MKEDCELLCRLSRLFIKIIDSNHCKVGNYIANKSKRKNIKLTITWLYYSKQFIIISNISMKHSLSFSYPCSLKTTVEPKKLKLCKKIQKTSGSGGSSYWCRLNSQYAMLIVTDGFLF